MPGNFKHIEQAVRDAYNKYIDLGGLLEAVAVFCDEEKRPDLSRKLRLLSADSYDDGFRHGYEDGLADGYDKGLAETDEDAWLR